MRWEVIRLYRDGERRPDSEILAAVGVVGDVRMQTVMRATKVVTEASLARSLPAAGRAQSRRYRAARGRY